MLLGQKLGKVFQSASSERLPGTEELRQKVHQRPKGEGNETPQQSGWDNNVSSCAALNFFLPNAQRSGPLHRGAGSSTGTKPPGRTRPPELPDCAASTPCRPPHGSPGAGPWQMSAYTRYGTARRTARPSAARGGAGSEPAPAGAALRSAAPMGGRAGRGAAVAVHVALSRWRPLWTELWGRPRGWGRRRVAAEGGGRGLSALALPPLPAGRGGVFLAPARLHHAAGLEAPQRSGVIMLAEVRALPRPVGYGAGSGSPSARAGSCAPSFLAERRLCPPPWPPTCLGIRQRPPWSRRAQAPAGSAGVAPGLPYHPSSLSERCSPIRGRQGAAGEGRLSAAAEPGPPYPLRAAAGRIRRVRPPSRSASDWTLPPGEGPEGRSGGGPRVWSSTPSEEGACFGPRPRRRDVPARDPNGVSDFSPSGLLLCGSFVKAPCLLAS